MPDPPDPSQVAPQQPLPDLGPDPTATPVLAGSPGSQEASGPPRPGRPILMDLISGLIKPPMKASAPGEMARPVSRLDTFESFLGNFINALGTGLQAGGHGPGANLRGAGAAIQAPYQQAVQQYGLQQQAEAQQAQTQGVQARTSQTQAQTAQMGQMVTLPDGTQVPFPLAGKMGAAAVTGQSRKDVANIQAKSKMGVEQMKAMLAAQQVSKIMPAQGADGKLVMRAIGKYGQTLGEIDGALPPASYLDKTSKTQEFKEMSDGSISVLPKTTTTGVVLGLGGKAVKHGTPVTTQATPVSGAQSVTGPGGGKVFGKAGGDVGYAYDPKTDENVQTTRAEASQQGLQQFNKLTGKESLDNTRLTNRLTDVATKLSRYEDTINTPISAGDKYVMSKILADDKFKAGVFGTELPVDFMNKLDKARNLGEISPQAQQRLVSYYNARESMVGYQQVLSGSGKSNEKAMQLNLDALPSPIQPENYSREAVKQFKENLHIAGKGIPRQPGIPTAADVLQGKGSGKLDSLVQKYGGK